MAEHSYSHAAKLNTGILAALIVLTIITVAAAGINFGSPSTNTVVAIAIASMKASLVAMFFMHLRYDKPINAVIFGIGVVTLGLFLVFVLLDDGSRPVVRPADLREAPGGPTQILGGEAAESGAAAESAAESESGAATHSEATASEH